MESLIEFPKLGLKFNLHRSFSLFGLEIHWYGAIICLGMLLCIALGMRYSKKYNFDTEKMLDYVICAVPSAIVGARLYYVIFSWDYYKTRLGEIVKIWSGGLAIYGGIIGAVLAIFIMSRIRKDKFLHLIDFAMPYIMLGQAIGRWGNFVNQEAYGAATNSIFGMTGNIIAQEMGEGVLVHPTFLYESLWCFAGFAFLSLYRSRLQKNYGEVTALYMIIYGAERALVEGLRTDSLFISVGALNLKVSQLLSVAIVIVGVALFADSRRRGNTVIRGMAGEAAEGSEAGNPADGGDDSVSSLGVVIEAMEAEENGNGTILDDCSETTVTTDGDIATYRRN